MEEVSAKLRQPFSPEIIKQRQGPGGRSFSYISGADVINRVIDATDNTYDFKILELTNMGNFFLARVSLHIPGLGEREGIGVQANIDANEDSIKGAITDGFKIAAKMFGVGLGLWSDSSPAVHPNYEGQSQAPQMQSAPAVREPGAPASEKQIYKIRAMVAERGGNPQIIDGVTVTKGKAHDWISQMMNGVLPEDLFPSTKQQFEKSPAPDEERGLYAMKLRRISESKDVDGNFRVEMKAVQDSLTKPNPDFRKLEWRIVELAKLAPSTDFLDELYDSAVDIPNGPSQEISSAISLRYDALMAEKM